MTQDVERDPVLERALRDIVSEPPSGAEISSIGRAIARSAEPELRRRRWRERRKRILLPAGLAASLAWLLLVTRMPEPAGPGAFRNEAPGATGQSIERLLDADLSDRQFRALLFGASEADDLLLIAAGDDPQ